MVKKIVLWILVISTMTAIFIFSSQPADESSATSGRFAYRVLSVSKSFRELTESEKHDVIESLQHVFRKGAHFSIYALLGFLIYLLLNSYAVRRALMLSPVLTALYAASDEIHQMFVSGRAGQLGDIMIDFLGALCGAIVAMAALFIIKRFKIVRKDNG